MGQRRTGINLISGLDIVEEGFYLFKNTLTSTFLFNLIGSVPFGIGLVYIIGDMSYGQATRVDIAGSALILTLLWMWNNLCQTVYRTRLVDYRCMRDATELNLPTLVRIFVRQNIIQPFGLILSPLAVFPVMWWMTAFFNVFGVDYRDNPGIREQLTRSKDIAIGDLKRIYLLMSVIWSFRVMMMINFAIIFLFIPGMLKMLFGIDTPFSQANSMLSGVQMIFNSTFFSSVIITAWVCCSPLEKAIWAVMIFYGESGKKGYDIIAALRVLARQRVMKIIILSMAVFSVIPAGTGVIAAETVVSGNKQAVEPAKLRNHIKQTLSQREYQWKLPVEREKKGESSSVIGSFIKYLVERVETAIKWGLELIRKIMRLFGDDNPSEGSKWGRFLGWLHAKRYIAIWSAVGLSLLIIGWFVLRWWREQRMMPKIQRAEPQAKVVDLTDEENVIADEMDEDEWLELAARLIGEGKRKLAMRAMFLAVIKALADNHLLTIARGKTNRDYRRELMRRSHSVPVRIELFNSNLGIFEKIWYGDYALINSDFDTFSANVKKIMNLGKL